MPTDPAAACDSILFKARDAERLVADFVAGNVDGQAANKDLRSMSLAIRPDAEFLSDVQRGFTSVLAEFIDNAGAAALRDDQPRRRPRLQAWRMLAPRSSARAEATWPSVLSVGGRTLRS